LADFREFGLRLAARFLENYLKADGDSIDLSRDEALEFDLARNGVETNIERFKQLNLIAPTSGNPAFAAVEEITKDPKATVRNFQDHWKIDFNLESDEGLDRFARAIKSDFRDTISALFSVGRGSLISTGEFLLQREGDRILVTGAITHVWTDLKYDFNPGTLFHPESQVLEKHKKAKPFKWEAKWEDGVLGELQIENAFSPNATRRWIRFEVNPLSL
jgi:hypothetical protein